MSIHLGDPTRPGVAAVDRAGPAPLYRQLKQWLAESILAGDLSPGARLPGELDLSARCGVSRGVVRQALTELRYEGLISRERGRGTFVVAPEAGDVAARGWQVGSAVLLLRESPAGADVAGRLGLEQGAPVVELERLRSLDGVPHALVRTYLPAALVPGLAGRDLGGSASLYRLLREHYGLGIVSSVRRVEAALAGAREARLLGVRRGDPLVVLRSVGYTTGDRPLDYVVAHHRGDRSAFEVIEP